MADHVFISYAHADGAFVLPLAERLRQSGLQVWIDDRGLQGGVDWERTIENALYDCAQFLIVLSPAAVASPEVRGEVRVALDEGKPILPVRYQECRIPPRLKLIQYVDYTARGVEDEQALQEVLLGLRARQAGGGTRRALWADRGRELDLFDQMVAGQSAARILLIEAEGGMGKSTLLREYDRRCAVRNARCVSVDLKGGLGLAEVLAEVGRGVGWADLPSFGAQVVELARAALPRARAGRAALKAALQVPDEATRRIRQSALTEDLLADLDAMPQRLVLILDTLDDADPNVREWLLDEFLGSVRRSRSLVAVAAGRPPLEMRTTWAACCEHVRLQRIDAQDWHKGIHDLHPALGISLQEIRFLCECLQGHPQRIGIALTEAIRTRSAAAARGGGR